MFSFFVQRHPVIGGSSKEGKVQLGWGNCVSQPKGSLCPTTTLMAGAERLDGYGIMNGNYWCCTPTNNYVSQLAPTLFAAKYHQMNQTHSYDHDVVKSTTDIRRSNIEPDTSPVHPPPRAQLSVDMSDTPIDWKAFHFGSQNPNPEFIFNKNNTSQDPLYLPCRGMDAIGVGYDIGVGAIRGIPILELSSYSQGHTWLNPYENRWCSLPDGIMVVVRCFVCQYNFPALSLLFFSSLDSLIQ